MCCGSARANGSTQMILMILLVGVSFIFFDFIKHNLNFISDVLRIPFVKKGVGLVLS